MNPTMSDVYGKIINSVQVFWFGEVYTASASLFEFTLCGTLFFFKLFNIDQLNLAEHGYMLYVSIYFCGYTAV